jgi:hypothetical protein
MLEVIDNKYKNWHDLIIIKTQQRNWTKKSAPCYIEKHHIIPKSLGGTNVDINLVCLTAKEHYIIHLLLTKFTFGNSYIKMIFAMDKLCRGNKEVRKYVSSRTGAIRITK